MTPYGEKALTQELSALHAVGAGDRNNALNLAAYRLSQLTQKGHISESDLARELEQAAAAMGLSSKEANSTITSGIKKGSAILRGPDPTDTYDPRPKLRPLVSSAPTSFSWQPDPTPAAPTGEWQQKAQAFIDYCTTHLMKSPEHIAYLAARGISEITAKWYNLGWFEGENGKDAFRPRPSWGLPPEEKEDGTQKKLWLPRGLVIPWKDIDGIHRIRIRREQNDPRYYVLPGSQMGCFITPKERLHRAYIIVESELDGIMLDAAVSDLCGVVALGNSSRKPDRRTWAAVSQAAKVLVCLDNDDAGRKATKWWTDAIRNAKPFPVPQGKDPGEAFQQGLDIRAWITSGLPPGWFMKHKGT